MRLLRVGFRVSAGSIGGGPDEAGDGVQQSVAQGGGLGLGRGLSSGSSRVKHSGSIAWKAAVLIGNEREGRRAGAVSLAQRMNSFHPPPMPSGSGVGRHRGTGGLQHRPLMRCGGL